LMNCAEYYPTDCELQIFTQQTPEICDAMIAGGDPFDLIELGAGDATKSTFLLKYLLEQKADFTYLPIDISSNVISYLNVTLPVTLPGLKIQGLNGDYFDMLKKAASLSNRRKVVLFLGSNIGNMPPNNAEDFCRELRNHLSPGDRVLIGIDLKKNPATVLAAYNDKGGITKRFNLNLLERINRELGADFNLTQFEHYPTYDPESGACKSYLVSQVDQQVKIGNESIHFLKDEFIYMEISQKYTVMQTNQMASNSGFNALNIFTDSKKWFIDAIWVAE
jgi:L-histidine N-alpha-methyltransferase